LKALGKGRVERAIRYIRDAFFAARTWQDLDDLNAQAAAWCAGQAADGPVRRSARSACGRPSRRSTPGGSSRPSIGVLGSFSIRHGNYINQVAM
jgi:hypothetical protein